ncbi:MAG: hypothetical protein KF729_34160 [Sandaracinaceae bacterium]|nr:hypothetical protein [Sandaracinaceae bacterium]
MSAGVRGCPTCGSGNATNSPRCWVCGAVLGTAPEHSEVAPAILADDGSTRALRIAGWSALLLGLGFTALLIAVQLALEWPGLLVPYALVVLVAFVALARTAWVQIRRRPAVATAAAQAGPPRAGVSGVDVAQGIALGLAIAIAVIAGLLLLALAGLVIFFLICLALLGGMQLH